MGKTYRKNRDSYYFEDSEYDDYQNNRKNFRKKKYRKVDSIQESRRKKQLDTMKYFDEGVTDR